MHSLFLRRPPLMLLLVFAVTLCYLPFEAQAQQPPQIPTSFWVRTSNPIANNGDVVVRQDSKLQKISDNMTNNDGSWMTFISWFKTADQWQITPGSCTHSKQERTYFTSMFNTSGMQPMGRCQAQGIRGQLWGSVPNDNSICIDTNNDNYPLQTKQLGFVFNVLGFMPGPQEDKDFDPPAVCKNSMETP